MISTIRAKLFLVGGLPMIGLILAAAIIGVSISERLQTVAQIEPIAQSAVAAGGLIHELQKERGRSVGMIKNPDSADGRRAVDTQRPSTDAQAAQFRRVLAEADLRAAITQKSAVLDQILSGLGTLPAHRARIDAGEMSVAETVAYFSDLIDAMINMMTVGRSLAHNELVSREISPFIVLAKAKEHAGLERALGGVLLDDIAEGRFSPEVFHQYEIRFLAEQLFLEDFDLLANAEQRAYFDRVVVGADIKQVAAWRRILAALPDTRDGQGVSGAAWFDAATRRIDRLKQVEGWIGDRLTAAAATEAGAARAQAAVLLVFFVVGVVVSVALMMKVAFSLTRRLGDVGRQMQRVAEGRTDQSTPGLQMADEVGQLARNLERLRGDVEQKTALEREAERARIAKEERAQALSDATRSFHATANEQLQPLASSARDLHQNADGVRGAAETIAEEVADLKTTARQTSGSVQTIAAAADEMAASVREISRRIDEQAELVAAANRMARDGDDRVRTLVGHTRRIEEVVKLINEIAEQTHLLALNATIEAARAGDAGRGFVVVANEVKSLAGETARATAEIGELVRRINAATNDVAGAFQTIATGVDDANVVATAVSGAMTQQTATMDEIARSVGEAADGAARLSDRLVDMAASVDDARRSAVHVAEVSDSVETLSSTLRDHVSGFSNRLDALAA